MANILGIEFTAQLNALFEGQDLDVTSLLALSDYSAFEFALNTLFGSVMTAQSTSKLKEIMYAGALLGVGYVASNATSTGGWDLVRDSVRQLADEKATVAVQQINATTRRALQREIGLWTGSGRPLSDLRDSIALYFSSWRANLIASSEVTRIYSFAIEYAMRASGEFVGKEWVTMQDELVCPVCGPLDGQRVALGEKFSVGEPPAHPGCRCHIVGVRRESSSN